MRYIIIVSEYLDHTLYNTLFNTLFNIAYCLLYTACGVGKGHGKYIPQNTCPTCRYLVTGTVPVLSRSIIEDSSPPFACAVSVFSLSFSLLSSLPLLLLLSSFSSSSNKINRAIIFYYLVYSRACLPIVPAPSRQSLGVS